MSIAVGIDVAKEVHWLVAISTVDGVELLNHRLGNDPAEILAAITELEALAPEHGPATVGLDVMGGIAGLLTAVLTTAGLWCVHVPGLVVNRARRATVGGENKSDPRDARVIAEQVRQRRDLRPIEVPDELLVQLRLLVSRRTDLVTEQTRRVQRLREHLVAMFPGLERATDPTNKSDLVLLARYVTPAEIRDAGLSGLRQHLLAAGVRAERAAAVARAVLSAAQAQPVEVAGQALIAELVRELAREALAVKRRLREIETRIGTLLDDHPDAALIASLPGMGAILTAELLATTGGVTRFASGNELAAAAGLAPVLQDEVPHPYGIHGVLEDRGHTMGRIQEDVGARMPTPDERERLGLPPGVPVLDVLHTSVDQDGEAYELTRFVLRADLSGLHYDAPVE